MTEAIKQLDDRRALGELVPAPQLADKPNRHLLTKYTAANAAPLLL